MTLSIILPGKERAVVELGIGSASEQRVAVEKAENTNKEIKTVVTSQAGLSVELDRPVMCGPDAVTETTEGTHIQEFGVSSGRGNNPLCPQRATAPSSVLSAAGRPSHERTTYLRKSFPSYQGMG